ncbi:hypothetical protein O181_013425 [Austropuccinia psidii MF-1]|uniref:Reverse transcriptase/retrotransposon-derived protein RNase H-like domain-containing protein n=1 Tax=Austropuccinia psidii MF-1 TaxID=1389203 RepID=A0A9Q3GNX1_9BASI|nr:hypothetical protein [Austropuccinia psidii MF-1]
MSDLPEKIPLIILDSSESPSLFLTHHTKYMVELPSFPSFQYDSLVIDTPNGEDLILGFYFLNHFNTSIDWRQGPITFSSDHKDYYGPSNSFSNDFSSSKSCAALVKAEKLPPHLACDQHIKLEGSSPEALRQFNQLKEAFTTAPVLCHLNPSLPTILETGASDYALDAVLSQASASGKHPIAFYSGNIFPEEFNYEIQDKEPLGIFWDLKFWRAFLLSLSSSFEVLTNHSSLKYFISSKILTCCQACWAEFHFTITYHPGCLTTLPDALSCQDNIDPERGDFISKNPMNYQHIIKKDEVQASKFFAVKMDSFSNLIDSIHKELWQDSQYRSILQDLGKAKSVPDFSLDSSSQILLFND